jgi:zinc transporter ZupT
MADFDVPTLAKWQAALFSTFLISTFPNIFLYLVPVSWLSAKKGSWFNIQHILLSFASGGLLGDVLLHAIPHLMAAHDSPSEEEGGQEGGAGDGVRAFMDSVQQEAAAAGAGTVGEEACTAHDTRSLVIGSIVLAGFLFFFTAERLITTYLHPPPAVAPAPAPVLTEVAAAAAAPEAHVATSDTCATLDAAVDIDYSALTVRDLKDRCRERGLPVTGKKADLVLRCSTPSLSSPSSPPPSPVSLTVTSSADSAGTSCPSPQQPDDLPFYQSLSASGWLNICADFLHNFTDGLAMGASHCSGDGRLALAATLSIFFHEVPHEIGDFTILIENGMR